MSVVVCFNDVVELDGRGVRAEVKGVMDRMGVMDTTGMMDRMGILGRTSNSRDWRSSWRH